MGQKYALASGESEAVAAAIEEHYLPRRAEDRLPQTLAGQVVGLADRLDTQSIFGLGCCQRVLTPALRRAAIIISLGQHSCRSICTRCWSKLL